MTNTTRYLALVAILVILSALFTIVLKAIIHHDVTRIEQTVYSIQDLQYRFQTLTRKQTEFIALSEQSQATEFEQSATAIATILDTLSLRLAHSLPDEKITDWLDAYKHYRNTFNEVSALTVKMGMSPNEGLKQLLNQHRTSLINQLAAIPDKTLLQQFLALQEIESRRLHAIGSSTLATTLFDKQYNRLYSTIENRAGLQHDTLLNALSQYQRTVVELSTLRNKLGKIGYSGLYLKLIGSQKDLFRTTNNILKTLKRQVNAKTDFSQNFLIIALSFIAVLLVYAGYVVWKALLVPMETIQIATNDALKKHGLSSFNLKTDDLPGNSHPMVVSFFRLVNGIETRVGTVKRFAGQLNDDIKLIMDGVAHANKSYDEQIHKLRRNEISLKALLRAVYKNTAVAKKAYLETSAVDKKLRRHNEVTIDSLDELHSIKTYTKRIANDGAQFSLYGSLAITSNKNKQGHEQDMQFDALKRQIQQLAINNRRSIVHMNKSLDTVIEGYEETLDYTGQSAQHVKDVKITMKSLMDSTVKQANTFNTMKTSTTQLYNDAKALMIETKCIKLAGKNAYSNIENMCHLLDYFEINEQDVDIEDGLQENTIHKNLKLDTVTTRQSDIGNTVDAGQDTKPARHKPKLQLVTS